MHAEKKQAYSVLQLRHKFVFYTLFQSLRNEQYV